MLLAKAKLNTVQILISKVLIGSSINHDGFVLVNNMLGECNEMKEEIKYPEMLWNVLNKDHGNVVSIVKKIYCEQKF